MTQGPAAAELIAIQPGSPEGRAVLIAYFSDIVSRYHGRQASRAEVAAAMRAEPSDDLCPPHGLLLAAVEDAARGRGLGRLGLDTRSDLTEARHLYAAAGYREVDQSGGGRHADHRFEKSLA